MKQEKRKNKLGACRHPMSKGTSDVQRVACKKAFSILELVIAIFVLTIGIIGALQLISSTIRNSINTRNSVIASGLAQEGVELVRNIRDNNMLLALSNLSLDREATFASHGFPVANSTCLFDYTFNYSSSIVVCGAVDNDAKLYRNNTTNSYAHTSTGSTETIFKRYVNFDYVNDSTDTTNPNPTGVNVTSYVWWGSAARPNPCNLASKCIFVNDYLPKRD